MCFSLPWRLRQGCEERYLECASAPMEKITTGNSSLCADPVYLILFSPYAGQYAYGTRYSDSL